MWLRPAVAAAAAQALLGVWPSDSDVGFFFSPRSSLDSELTSLCQSVLEDFNLCLFYLPSPPNLSSVSEDEEEYESGYSFLPDLLIFRMVIICFMSVHSLRRAGELCWDAQNLSAGSHQLVFSWRSVAGNPLGLTALSLQAPSSTAQPSLSRWPSSLTSSTTSTFGCRRSWRKGRTPCRRSAAMAQVGAHCCPRGGPSVSGTARRARNETVEPSPLQRVGL